MTLNKRAVAWFLPSVPIFLVGLQVAQWWPGMENLPFTAVPLLLAGRCVYNGVEVLAS